MVHKLAWIEPRRTPFRDFLFAAERGVLHDAEIEPARQLGVDQLLALEPDFGLRLIGAKQRGDGDGGRRAARRDVITNGAATPAASRPDRRRRLMLFMSWSP